jgi:hypothetical protein
VIDARRGRFLGLLIAAFIVLAVGSTSSAPREEANVSAISSSDAVRYAKLWLVKHDAFADGIVQGSVDSSGNGSLTGRQDVVVPDVIGAIPVWHVSFPTITVEPGGEPHIFVSQDDTVGDPSEYWVLDHYFTQ